MNAFEELMAVRGLGKAPEKIKVVGADPVLPSGFALGETSANIHLAIGVAVNDLWEMKAGQRQDLKIKVEHAAAVLRSYMYLQVDNDQLKSEFRGQVNRQGISTPHRTKDGRYLLPHMGLPHLAERVLKILDCEYELDSVVKAVATWDALDLENAIAQAGACGAMVRSTDEWLRHPQGLALSNKPVIEIIKIADSEPQPMVQTSVERPLAGIRVLDLTRILAGPTCARTLAEHGADVLMVTAKKLPQTNYFVADTSHGKRSSYLDFGIAADREKLVALIKEADVFSQGYRPGVMARHGLSPEELAEIRPGIICTSMNCYGYDGPFADRAGWEQLAQTVTGIAHEQGGERPRLLPAAACDYMTGYLAAYGTLLAMGLRARIGGSYHVKASLCQSGMLLQRQHRIDYDENMADINSMIVDEVMLTSQTLYGEMNHLGPILKMKDIAPNWDLPSPPLGTHEAVWL
ncbi:MAG: CoA transferase [Pseudomonadales bacterium]